MSDDCVHPDFFAEVEISRLFSSDVAETDASNLQPNSLAIDVKAWCQQCGKPVRFEGPIGVDVGPGSVPKVSLDGLELRAAGHMGDNNTPSIRVGFYHE